MTAERWRELMGDPESIAFRHGGPHDPSKKRCSRMCLHGVAKHDPELFSGLIAKLALSQSAVTAAEAANAVAPDRSASVYERPMLGGAARSELAEAAAKVEKKLQSHDSVVRYVYQTLLSHDCCVDGALAFVGKGHAWAYFTHKAELEDVVPTHEVDDATGATTSAAATSHSRAPGVEDKRLLRCLPSVDEVRALTRPHSEQLC